MKKDNMNELRLKNWNREIERDNRGENEVEWEN